MIEVYTDGAYNPVTDRGGWAAVLLEKGQKRVHSGAVQKTTNNRMELTAALEGIRKTPQDAEVVVYTDSTYVFGCMTKGWQRKANIDIMEKLDEAVGQRKVRWQWIDQTIPNPFQKEAHTTATGLSQGEEKAEPAPAVLSHIDETGRPRMVDVTAKPETQREAVAKGMVRMKPETMALVKKGQIDKGDVLTVAQLAGIMSAKQTSHLIPLCHPLLIGEVKIEFRLGETDSSIEITSTVKSTGKTGVEMEALTATAVAALTIYDMCKAVDRGMRIESIRLVRKSGGKSGTIVLE